MLPRRDLHRKIIVRRTHNYTTSRREETHVMPFSYHAPKMTDPECIEEKSLNAK